MKKIIIAILLISMLLVIVGCGEKGATRQEVEQEPEVVEEMPEEELPVEEETEEEPEEELEEPEEEEEEILDISMANDELVFDVECIGDTRTVTFKLANPTDRTMFYAVVGPKDRAKYYPAKVTINGRSLSGVDDLCGTLKLEPNDVVSCKKTYPVPMSINDRVLRTEEDENENHIRAFIAGKASEVLFTCY
jgi:hypothetical protein